MTDFSFTYEIAAWHLLVLVVFALILCFLEWKRKKRNRFLRVTALVVGIISLYIIYLKPYISVEKPYKSVVLVGENVSKSLAEYLNKFSDYEVLFWNKQTHLLQSKKQNVSYSFSQLDYSIDTLFIRGYVPPLNPAYYQHLVYSDTLEQDFKIDYPEKVLVGDTVFIKISNESAESILLWGMVGNDTLKQRTIKGGENFVHQYIPKTSGFHRSKIVIDEQEEYNFSISVEDKRKYVFHLLAESPDFEWRFLKDFLGEEGHAVYSRSKISRNKYKTGFVNWPDSLAQQQSTYNPLFSNILVTDMEAWNSMGSSLRKQYQEELQKQQGVILFRANQNSRLNLQTVGAGLNGTVSVGNYREGFDDVKVLNVIDANAFTKSLGQLSYYAILADLGIGITPIQDTYRWQLAGEEQRYKQYWTTTFNQLLRDPDNTYHVKTRWPVQFQPFHFQIWADGTQDKLLLVDEQEDSIHIDLIPDTLYPERQHLVYYPTQVGWYKIFAENNGILDQFYVHPVEAEVQSLMDLSYKFKYSKYMSQISSAEKLFSSNNKDKPLILWFFLLFLLCISFLWIEEKI